MQVCCKVQLCTQSSVLKVLHSLQTSTRPTPHQEPTPKTSSHLYLYSAFNNTDCVKALNSTSDDLSIIRSSCPPSHRWASLGFHFAGLNPISPVGLSGWPGEGRYPKHINWSLGFLRDRFLDPSSSPHTLHHWDPSYRHMASPTIATPMTHSSISLFNQMIQR